MLELCHWLSIVGLSPHSHCGDEEDGCIGLSSWLHCICIMLLALCLLSTQCVMNQFLFWCIYTPCLVLIEHSVVSNTNNVWTPPLAIHSQHVATKPLWWWGGWVHWVVFMTLLYMYYTLSFVLVEHSVYHEPIFVLICFIYIHFECFVLNVKYFIKIQQDISLKQSYFESHKSSKDSLKLCWRFTRTFPFSLSYIGFLQD